MARDIGEGHQGVRCERSLSARRRIARSRGAASASWLLLEQRPFLTCFTDASFIPLTCGLNGLGWSHQQRFRMMLCRVTKSEPHGKWFLKG